MGFILFTNNIKLSPVQNLPVFVHLMRVGKYTHIHHTHVKITQLMTIGEAWNPD